MKKHLEHLWFLFVCSIALDRCQLSWKIKDVSGVEIIISMLRLLHTQTIREKTLIRHSVQFNLSRYADAS